MPRYKLCGPDFVVGTGGKSVFPDIGDIQRRADDSGAHFIAKQAIQELRIKRQQRLRKDGIAQPLQFLEDALAVVKAVCRLIAACQKSNADEGNRGRIGTKCELELELGREGHGVPIVNNIEIGDEAQYTLLFLNLDLFYGDLFGRGIHGYRARPTRDRDGAVFEVHKLAWAQDDRLRDPVDKSFDADLDVIRDSWLETIEVKCRVIVCKDNAILSSAGLFKDNLGAGNDVTVRVHDGAADTARLQTGCSHITPACASRLGT